MRTIAAIVILAAATAVSGAAQAETRLSDSQYIAAARCRGLTTGDAAAIEAVLEANRAGRVGVAVQQADVARRKAERQVRKARGAGQKAEVARDQAAVCAAFVR
ncbi:MAG: hypothetical protein ACOY4K_15570 [Pseudomonadota bacterium]